LFLFGMKDQRGHRTTIAEPVGTAFIAKGWFSTYLAANLAAHTLRL